MNGLLRITSMVCLMFYLLFDSDKTEFAVMAIMCYLYTIDNESK